ncbi:MAG: exo-alpha-sialidase, partial [Planctomycetaceae bacterium]|nr:exo-alpha-sialidase [Planctomycetaceae bacterium]
MTAKRFATIITFCLTATRILFADGDVTDVVQVDQLDPASIYERIWEPHLAKWSDKQLVCCYGLQLRGKPDMGDIVCSVSKDGGKTWLPRTMVFDHRLRNGTVQYAYNNAVLFRPPGQDIIWLFCMRAPLQYRDSENAELVAAYTADGGLSWTQVEVANAYQGPLIIVAGMQTVVRDGVPHYLLPAHRNTLRRDRHGDRRQFVLESTSLLHWKMAEYVDYPTETPVFLHEGKIAPSDDGDGLKIVMRTADMERERPLDPPVAWSSVSNDLGRTWSVAKPEPALPNFRSKAFFGVDSNGTHIYVYSDNANREGLWYKTRQAGDAWSEAKCFYHENNLNSYPTLVEDQSGKWIAVWDSSNE